MINDGHFDFIHLYINWQIYTQYLDEIWLLACILDVGAGQKGHQSISAKTHLFIKVLNVTILWQTQTK